MTPQERDLILSVAQRLRSTPLTDKDLEAAQLIQNEIGSQKNALYQLTQAVIVQEQGLRHAQERIQQLERDLQAARQQAGAQPQQSFLGGLFGIGAPATPPPLPAAAPPAAPVYPMPPSGGSSGAGSFLRSAAAAAAGVVGGHLIWDGLQHWLGGGSNLGSFMGGHGSGINFGQENAAPPTGDWAGGWSPTPVQGRHAAAEAQDTDASGVGGDFGDANVRDTSGELDNDAAGGGDFGSEEDNSVAEDDQGGGDFTSGDEDTDDQGGGNY